MNQPPRSDLQVIADGVAAQADPVMSSDGTPIDDTTGGDAVRHTRISAAWLAVAIGLLLGVGLIAFIVQNTRPLEIKFLGASGHVPTAVALLAAAVIGGIIVLVVGISRITQLRLSARRRARRAKNLAG
jgi:uncharacterized integral membrane protein